MRLRHVLARVATVACALPIALAFTGAAPAQAQTVEVPGCYGAVVVYCDPAIEITLPVGLQPFTTVIPVCAGTCTEIPVTAYTVTFPSNPQICLKVEDRNGNQSRTCVPLSIGQVGVPTVENCYNGETGVIVRDGDGNTIWNLCVGQVGPNYHLEECNYWEAGYRIVDEYGNTVYNLCFNIEEINLAYVEPCTYPYVGVYVYDQHGNEIAGRCVRVGRVPTLQEICAAANQAAEPWLTISDLNCRS